MHDEQSVKTDKLLYFCYGLLFGAVRQFDLEHFNSSLTPKNKWISELKKMRNHTNTHTHPGST